MHTSLGNNESSPDLLPQATCELLRLNEATHHPGKAYEVVAVGKVGVERPVERFRAKKMELFSNSLARHKSFPKPVVRS